MTTDPQLLAQASQRILGKLQQAWKKGLLPQSKNKGKRYGLLPAASEAQVVEFESQHGVLLPQAYRYLITVVGAGGTGPYYGLLPFHDVVSHCDISEKERDASGGISAPCPMWPGTPDCVDSPLSYDCFPWDYLLRGTLTIAYGGCSDIIVLIVTGKYRGRVVHVDLESTGQPCVTLDTDFLAWYERWIDELLRGWNVSDFGRGYPGDEAAILQVLQSPSHGTDCHENALSSLLRVPQLDGALAFAVVNCLNDPRQQNRVLAAQIIHRHTIQTGGDALASRAADPDPGVRAAAIRALVALKHPGWEDLAKIQLHDSSHDVVFAAVCVLKNNGPIAAEDLIHLFDSANPDNRTTAIFAWANTGLPITSSSWFPKIINDDNLRVLSQLICAARDRREKAILPYLNLIETRMPGKLGAEIESTRRLLSWSVARQDTAHFFKQLSGLPILLYRCLRRLVSRNVAKH